MLFRHSGGCFADIALLLLILPLFLLEFIIKSFLVCFLPSEICLNECSKGCSEGEEHTQKDVPGHGSIVIMTLGDGEDDPQYLDRYVEEAFDIPSDSENISFTENSNPNGK